MVKEVFCILIEQSNRPGILSGFIKSERHVTSSSFQSLSQVPAEMMLSPTPEQVAGVSVVEGAAEAEVGEVQEQHMEEEEGEDLADKNQVLNPEIKLNAARFL